VVGISEFKIFGFWEEQYGEGAGGFFSPSQFYLAVLEAIAVFFWNRESFC
jgi:hypothetical protein